MNKDIKVNIDRYKLNLAYIINEDIILYLRKLL